MIIKTNAPESYDYWGTRYVCDALDKRGPVTFRLRVVTVPDDNADAQAERYRSGMYVVIDR